MKLHGTATWSIPQYDGGTMTLDREALLELVACPTCKGRMQSLSVCDHCGTCYGEVNGIPALFPDESSYREVSFEFSPGRSLPTDDFTKCFSYPPRCGGAEE